jgi:hypothetical protein
MRCRSVLPVLSELPGNSGISKLFCSQTRFDCALMQKPDAGGGVCSRMVRESTFATGAAMNCVEVGRLGGVCFLLWGEPG